MLSQNLPRGGRARKVKQRRTAARALASFTASALLSAGGFAATPSQDAAANTFDDQALLQNVTNLSTQWPGLFSAAELRVLRQAIKEASRSAIEKVLAKKVPIEVTINPEARISARRTGAPLPAAQCGTYSTWLIRIVNEGYVTAPLFVHVTANPATSAVTLRNTQTNLTGGDLEYRPLSLRIEASQPIEVVFLFSAVEGATQLGRQPRLPVLVTCRQPHRNESSGAREKTGLPVAGPALTRLR
jgi:hypothetical protein